MNIIHKFIRTATALLAVPLLLVNVSALGQEQVLAEVGVVGENSNGDGVVRPDFTGRETSDYTDWVAPAGNRDYRGFAISPKGTALVLDGNFIREFNVAGVEKDTSTALVNGFPVDCTAIEFNMPKKNGRPKFVFLSECGAFTPLNDDTLRIAGEAQGGGFVVIKYDPSGPTGSNGQTGSLAADGTPPSITDMDGDEFADAVDRKGTGYWAVGDKKKVIWFPLDPPDTEQDFEVVATLNGKRIDSVTPFGPGRVIVALDTGQLMSIDTSTGDATAGPVLASAEECELGRKDPQRYSVRGDPTGVLFAGNRGGSGGNIDVEKCNAITLFNESLGEIDDVTDDMNASLVANPFVLANSSTGADRFFIEGLDWQSGQGGDFEVDCGDPLILNDPQFGCQYGAVPGQATMFEVELAQNSNPMGPQLDTTYRMFQFVDLVDCRHSGNRPCPILNCPAAAVGGDEYSCPDPDEQVLNLTELLLDADQTGVFTAIAFGDDTPPIMAIPPYMRGEDTYPDSNGEPVDNGFKFVSFFAVTDAIFVKTFFVDYQIDLFRPGDSVDPCFIPPPGSSFPDPTKIIPAIDETANLIVYNSGDGFGTIDRSLDLANQGNVQGTRGGIIGNSFCNGGATRARWSANTIGLELYDPSPTAYLTQVERMMGELVLTKEQLICAAFPNPEYDLILNPMVPETFGPLLADCTSIENALDQVEQKLGVCIDSLFAPQQGNSAENCNAFFTKVTNLENVLIAAPWPDPTIEANWDVLRPNYEGEFSSRIDAFRFFAESYMLNGVPDGGH